MFERSVFINCPFDFEYARLLRPLLFTIRYLGFNPRIASESMDSGKPRIAKILDLIESCRFGIHDLSRIKAEKEGDIARFNMPLKLGMDIGCRQWGTGPLRTKQCLILEKERYRYQAAISDLSGSDIAVHNNEPSKLVPEIRNWLFVAGGLKEAPGGAKIWYDFSDFWGDIYQQLRAKGFSEEDIEKLPIREFMAHADRWIAEAVR